MFVYFCPLSVHVYIGRFLFGGGGGGEGGGGWGEVK